MNLNELNDEFQKVIDETSEYWDSKTYKDLVKSYEDEKGKISLESIYALLRDQSAQYSNQLVYNALVHFLIDYPKENQHE